MCKRLSTIVFLVFITACGRDHDSNKSPFPTSGGNQSPDEDFYNLRNSHFLFLIKEIGFSVGYHFLKDGEYRAVAAKLINANLIQAMAVKGLYRVDGQSVYLTPTKTTCRDHFPNHLVKIADQNTLVVTKGAQNISLKRMGFLPEPGSVAVTTGCILEDLRFIPEGWSEI